MAEADIGSKWLIGHSPEAWVRWALDDPTLVVEEQLSTEFQHVMRLSDSLLLVRDEQGTFLVLTELQLRYDERMPVRVRAYTALAEEKYNLSVYPIIFYLLPPPSGKVLATHYHSSFRGIEAHQDFRIIKAWELKAQEVVQQQNLVLLPFVPLMHGATEQTIRTSAQLLRQQPEAESLEVILALFARFVLDPETVQQIVRWSMDVLRESPLYQEILQQGLEQGLQQGLQQGVLAARRTDILDILQTRFALDASVRTTLSRRLDQIESADVLHTLLMTAVQVSDVEQFHQALEQQEQA